MATELKRMQQLRADAAGWAANDIIVGDGEIAVEFDGAGGAKVKVGDGIRAYSALPFVAGAAAGGGNFLPLAGGTLTGPLRMGQQASPIARMRMASSPNGAFMEIAPDSPTGDMGFHFISRDSAGTTHTMNWTRKGTLVIPNKANSDFMGITCQDIFNRNTLVFTHTNEDGDEVGVGSYVFQCDVGAGISVVITPDGHVSTVAAPTNDTHLANKKYVDDLVGAAAGGNFLPTAGGSMTGSIVFAQQTSRVRLRTATAPGGDFFEIAPNSAGADYGIHLVTTGANGEQRLQWTRKGVLVIPNQSSGDWMGISCHTIYGYNSLVFAHTTEDGNEQGQGTFVFLCDANSQVNVSINPAGQVTAAAVPTNDVHLCNKKYVDAQISTGSGLTQAQADGRYLKLAGGTVTGHISRTVNPTAANHLARKGYVDSAITTAVNALNLGITQAYADNRYLKLAGGNMTGTIVFAQTATRARIRTANAAAGDFFEIAPNSSGSIGIHLVTTGPNGEQRLQWTRKGVLVIPNKSSADYMGIEVGTIYGVNSLIFTHTNAEGDASGTGAFVFQCNVALGTAVVIDNKGNVVTGTAPTSAAHLCNKSYVDSKVASAGGGLTQSQGDARYLRLAGGTLAGQVITQTMRPNGANSWDLGLSTVRYRNIYLNNQPNVNSDARMKTSVADLAPANIIDSLRPVAFRYKEDMGVVHWGFVAQEAIQALGDDADESALVTGDDADGYGMAHGELIAPLVAKVQYLEAELNKLKQTIH